MTEKWKVKKADGSIYGPVDVETLRQWIKDERVSEKDYISPEDKEEWELARALPEFSGFFTQPAEKSSSRKEKAEKENTDETVFNLLEGEKIYKRLHSHVFAFCGLYFVWLYVIVFSLLFIIYGKEISDLFSKPLSITSGFIARWAESPPKLPSIPLLGNTSSIIGELSEKLIYILSCKEYVPLTLWLFFIMLSFFVISFIRISYKWTGVMLIICGGSLMLLFNFNLPLQASYYAAIVFSLIGVFCVGIYRRSHKFYITNYRIITVQQFVGRRQNELSYDKINNMIIDQSLIGRIFNFGTLIPITASGLGMGEDATSVTAGGGRQFSGGLIMGGAITYTRSMKVPRTASAYALYEIPNPQETYNLISKFMHEYLEAPYLKDIRDFLKKRRNPAKLS